MNYLVHCIFNYRTKQCETYLFGASGASTSTSQYNEPSCHC